ncbi:flavin-containing monooxygenase [Phytohabitans rumicis]|uniref:Monooxygenase n=1 Tax=Phytohabitans rumicis TaxID=1076125 RepID=A0A6V8LDC9_9ACTN|nr:NAD(P)/FAD-dependent oxidoreductase [Phytohabitans rumicis]GFJ95233.1 hypothetical protein Prum_088750 [Phytohabitans rumicis]
MSSIHTVVIGAGHAGLAVSRCLTDRGVEHVVIERGRLAERWRSARWESFRMLTPNWLSRLPGWVYRGGAPDGFMTAGEFVRHMEGYAASFAAPVLDQTTVTEVRAVAGGYLVRTDRGCWTAANVVIATGYHARARVPGCAAALPVGLAQLTSAAYREPAGLPAGGVLVVGASASGVQIADELRRAGREVTLAVGRHTRLPRRYRGRDIFWWLDRVGSLDRTADELPERAHAEPSPQLSGAGRAVDLAALARRGVTLAGRLAAVERGRVRFADDLPATTAAADARLRRVLTTIDGYAGAGAGAAAMIRPATVTPGPRGLDLERAGIGTVIWATGFRPSYPWLNVPVLDGAGLLRHRRGVTAAPGLYAIGLRFQHRRSATYVDGARHDAAFLADHLAAHHLACRRA